MDQTTPDRPPGLAAPAGPAPSRRHVLALLAAAGPAAAVLGACGGDNDGDAGGPGTSSSPSETSGAGASGPLVATAKVPVGGGVILDKQKVVVTQPSAGTFKAFSATCTHRGCTVGSVKDGRISCPCHGSAYSATDGSVLNGPATRALAEVPVSVQGGQVVES